MFVKYVQSVHQDYILCMRNVYYFKNLLASALVNFIYKITL